MMVSFIIPVYNHFELTEACIRTLLQSLPRLDYEIIIVDDFSDSPFSLNDDSLPRERFAIVRNARNLGYAKSNNIGAKKARGDILFLLNNDLEFESGWFEPMMRAVSRKANGVVGNIQIDAETGVVDHAGFAFDRDLVLRHKRSRNRFRRLSAFTAVTGACLAIRRSVYFNLGGLDEAYENGCEDIDLCFNALENGFNVVVANDSQIRHHVSSTRGENQLRDERNMRRFQDKWRSRIASEMSRIWPRHYLRGALSGEKRFDRKQAWDALIRLGPIKLDPTPCCSLVVEAKLKRNERHWRKVLDGESDEMIKQSYFENLGKWMGTQFSFKGLEPNRIAETGRWIREIAEIHIGSGFFISSIQILGAIKPEEPDRETHGSLGLRVSANGADSHKRFPLPVGDFELSFEDVPAVPEQPSAIEIELIGAWKSNAYAYLGRVTRKWFFLPRNLRQFWKLHREQKLNQRLIVKQVKINHEMLLDFENQPTSPVNFDFLRRSTQIGVNLVGWFDAELGVGESVRLAAKALDTTTLNTNLVPLLVNCLASREDKTFDDRLVEKNNYPINIFHIDAPQSADVDHHHGENFRREKYNIGYWAWELPEFPDDWIRYFKYFDEIWAPSNFVRESIAMKSPIPVLTVPHCIDFDVPEKRERAKFSLPEDKFLFLFAYDLNSYQPRKNPQAAIEAFKLAFPGSAGKDVGLVIKTHSVKRNREAFAELQKDLHGIDNIYLIENRLSREDVYSLMYSVDAYVSLHRAEGFGLTVAESMFLGKPVISTNWSSTTEFLDVHNGCPVAFKLVEIPRSCGPYTQGQIWANAEVGHAAEYMLRLADDSEFAKEIGDAASRSIRERFSPEAIGKKYEKRIKSLTLW